MAKKVLIVTYYWPPAGGPGVQRWLKFAKYLPDFGWEPVIYTPRNPSYPITDLSLAAGVPEGITVLKTGIWEPYQLAEKLNKSNKKYKAGQFDIGAERSWKSRLSIWVRGNFFIPDARVFWVKPSVQYLRKYLKDHDITTLVTTGPPHSMHLIGLELKKQFPELKWIADFRDPWTEISYFKHLMLSRRSKLKHHALEKRVFLTADITLATSYSDAENFRKAGANAVCVTNGFDGSPASAYSGPSEKFTISYIGVLEQLRNPEILWNTLAEVVADHPEFGADLRIKFVGRTDEKIMTALLQSPLGSLIQNLGYLPHDEAVAEMQDSVILLITSFPDRQSKGIIPGKIFEYLAARRVILSFGPADADVKQILQQTASGEHFGYSDKERLKAFLLTTHRRWKNGENLQPNGDITEFSRRTLTEKLSALL